MQLKNELIKIQLALKKNDLESALKIYQKINKNWEEYRKSLKKEEIPSLIKLTEFIKTCLLEKREFFINRKNFLIFARFILNFK